MYLLSLENWSPYACGIGIGVLSWLCFLLAEKPIGCSTAFARTSGMIEKLFYGKRTLDRPYFQKFVPEIDWEWMLVAGIFIGAYLSSKMSGTFEFKAVPDTWAAAFGSMGLRRWVFALVGGILMGIGARWAGGCTSGHGISGTLQLAASGWLAAICFFIGGIFAAVMLYGGFSI